MHFRVFLVNKRLILGFLLTFIALVYIYSTSRTLSYIKSLFPDFVWPVYNDEEAAISLNATKDFEEDWCRALSARTDWQTILKTCDEQISWSRKSIISGSYLETDASVSFVSRTDIRPAGEFSKIFISTLTRNGIIKTIGGDSWRVVINGTASINAHVFDYGNGTYEVLFLCEDEGEYTVHVFLDYSMCNGLLDPPDDWFIKGSSQGKNQGLNVIGEQHDFLMVPLKNTPFTVQVRNRRIQKSDKEPFCKGCSAFLWNGIGRWKDIKWMPFFQENATTRHSDKRLPSKKPGNLLIYGDSVSVFFAQSLKQRRKLCGEIFKSCQFVYNWIYNIKNASLAKKQRDNLDFNVTRVVSEFEEAILSNNNNRNINHNKNNSNNGGYSNSVNNNNVVIFNFGLHFVESTNFSNYKVLMQEIVRMLKRRTDSGEKSVHGGNFIWKSTTAINKERADHPQLHWRRFFTNYRIQLYNAYAADIMCRHGIHVIDTHPISASYPLGTGTHSGKSVARNDIVHYNNEAFYPIEEFLEEYYS